MTILNIDIGGGTTKLALVDRGNVVHTAALHIGGRLAVFDDQRRLTRLDPAGKRLATLAGVDWTLGAKVTDEQIERVTNWMADALLAALTERAPSPDVQGLWLTEPLAPAAGGPEGPPLQAEGPPLRAEGTPLPVMVSGGVGEYVYERETHDFGDLGVRLGRAIRQRFEAGRFPFTLLPPGECIRATALGASEYSVQLSGNTIYLSNPGELLPRKNLQVLQPALRLGDVVEASSVAAAIGDHFERFDLVEGDTEVALAFRWRGAPSYQRLAGLARGIVEALPRTIAAARPVFLIFDGDVAQTIGALLKEELAVASDVLALDGIALWDFDYIDLGRVRMPSFTVPVTIKSLVFSQDPRIPHSHHHHHHHVPSSAEGHHEGHHHHHHHHDHV